MPRVEGYVAEVTVSVVLRSEEEGMAAAEYSVTRKAYGNSGNHRPTALIDTATSAAVAASKALGAGVDNAEARRLK